MKLPRRVPISKCDLFSDHPSPPDGFCRSVIDRTYLSAIERGIQSPTLTMIMRLSNACYFWFFIAVEVATKSSKLLLVKL